MFPYGSELEKLDTESKLGGKLRMKDTRQSMLRILRIMSYRRSSSHQLRSRRKAWKENETIELLVVYGEKMRERDKKYKAKTEGEEGRTKLRERSF